MNSWTLPLSVTQIRQVSIHHDLLSRFTKESSGESRDTIDTINFRAPVSQSPVQVNLLVKIAFEMMLSRFLH